MVSDMKKLAAFNRAAYLRAVPAKHRELAATLCDILESTFGKSAVSLHTDMPVVMRDMEWIAGFAIRANGPRVYICAPHALEVMKTELAPWMSGKACFELAPKRGRTIPEGLALIKRAFTLAKSHPGLISKANLRKRTADVSTRAASSRPRPDKPKKR